ncbi:MAG TPA: Ig-like domain-containing protein [Gemmataceae bacterium]|nr:Ig-like domain-containing protein [Gemmataceae bacterium]
MRKYDADGNELWTRQFGTAGLDLAAGIAADSSGVYVVGQVSGALPGQSFAGLRDSFVRKYDADGNEAWTREFSAGGSDAARCVVADNTGVYLAGVTDDSFAPDVFVRKYDASGNQVWARQFGSSQGDAPNGIASDASGVYVAGLTTGVLPGQTGENFDPDSFVRKYDPSGSELWTRQFSAFSGTFHVSDGAQGVAVDASGVYVSGFAQFTLPGQTSAGGNDAYVRKYDGSGTELWTRQFGTAGDENTAGIAADGSGIYVVGTTTGGFPGQIATGGTDTFLRRYDASGAAIWTRQFGTGLPGANDIARAVDADGNIYVAGEVTGFLPGQTVGRGSDVFVRKYDAAGNELWTREFGGANLPGVGTVPADSAAGIAVDASGVYVAGYTVGILPGQTNLGGQDAFVRKYDAAGNELWTRQFGTAGSDLATAIAVDALGVYVTGSTSGVFPGQFSGGLFVRKYDAAGNELWTHQFGSFTSDKTTGIAADGASVYVSGFTGFILPGQISAGGQDAFVRAYSTFGNERWTHQFGTAAMDQATGIAVGPSGVYVSGLTTGTLPGQASAGGQDAFVRAYTTFGDLRWTRQFGTPGLDQADGVAIVAADVYVAGSTAGALPGQTSAGDQDAFVRKYDAEGAAMWTDQFGTAAADSAMAVAVSPTGVFIAGATSGTFPAQTGGGGQDVFVARIVDNQAPVAGADFYSVDEDNTLTVTTPGLLANDSDTEGDALSAVLVTGPAHGSLMLNADGSFTYSPDANFDQTDFFTYRVSDGANKSNTATVLIQINPVNDPPVANDDAYSVAEDTTLTIEAPGVLANDFDVDLDPDIETLYAILISGPSHGTLTLDTDGSFIYTPDADYNGLDSFTYKDIEPFPESAAAVVRLTITPVNDAPLANADNYNLPEDTTLTVNAPGVLSNDTDVDGDALAAILVAGSSHGTLALNADGSFSYTPALHYTGPDSFTYQANDGTAGSAPAVVDLTITAAQTNTPPSNLALAIDPAIDENGTATLSGSFADPDAADSHTVVINWGPGEGITTLNLAAGRLTFSAGHQYLDDNPTGTPSDLYTVLVTVTDDHSASDSGSTAVTVRNVAPMAVITGPASGAAFTAGTSITFTGAFSDAGTADTHTAQWTFDAVTITGSVSEANGSDTVSDAYTFKAPGVYRVSLVVTDDDGSSGSDSILVTVLPRPTSTNLSSAANPSVFGQMASFTATVTATPDGMDHPTGTVQFQVDGSNFGNPIALVNSTASFSTDALPVGAHTITAVYSGADLFAPSTSIALKQIINPAGTAATASVSAPTPLFGVDSLSISAAVAVVAPGSGGPAGSITFYDGSFALGAANLVDGTAALALGNTALAAGPHTIRALYSGDANFLSSDATVALTVLAPSTIQGLVYADFNNDGQVDFGEGPIAGVTIALAGTDDLGNAVSRTLQTDANGVYAFVNLRPSNAAGYTLTETQPAELLDGRDTLGMVNGVPTGSAAVNDTFAGLVLSQGGSSAENYNFGERPATTGGVASGQTATIGFWQNPNGQKLVLSLNGGATATQLGHWLAVTFPNLYGSLDGMTNAGVAAFYKQLFARTSHTAPGGPPKVDAQVLATALAVYVTNQTLAGTAAAAYGFQISAAGVGARTFDVAGNGAAFGVANNSRLSVMDLLLAVNARAHKGLLYDMNGNGQIDGSEVGYRTMANDIFSAINEAGDI